MSRDFGGYLPCRLVAGLPLRRGQSNYDAIDLLTIRRSLYKCDRTMSHEILRAIDRGFAMELSKLLSISAVALLAAYASASAQSVAKTWVSSTGSDTGTCDISAPCGSLQYAFNQTAVGGEVEVRDSGNYGPLNINHGVSVISTSAGATLSDYGYANTGIFVAAGSSDIVTIRGLTINGHNASGVSGIYVSSGKTVVIDHCIISGATTGIYLVASNTYFLITNNIITGNNYGIRNAQSAYVALGGNNISGNAVGVTGGTIYTYDDNRVNTNTTADENSVTASAASKY